jgi:hypothetical protein
MNLRVSEEHPTPEEEKEIERSASRALVFIIIGAVVLILLFWLIGFDVLRDALS